MAQPPRSLPRLAVLALACVALLPLAARPRMQLPPIVFVQRERVPGSLLVPGIGPGGRLLATGGKLVVRDADGSFHPLLEKRFFDVSAPAVSYDGRQIAFAAVTHRDSSWRIWRCDLYGRGLTQVTRSDRALDLRAFGDAAKRFARYDDLQPCWLPDGRIVFASTRWPWIAQQGGQPATNLYVCNADGSALERLTSERNGGESPSVDPRTGRIVYAQWFFNRYLASDDATGLTTDRAAAMPADTVDLWHAVSIDLDGDHVRLAGGDPRTRLGQMAYQPVLGPDSTLFGVCAERGSMLRATRLGLQSFHHGFAAATPLAGFGSSSGWSAACPCLMPDGTVLFSMDADGTGNWDLYLTTPAGGEPVPLVVETATLELDPALLAPRPLPPLLHATHDEPLAQLPPTSLAELLADPHTARFDCLDVFANGPVDGRWPDAVPPVRDARIRFYAALARPNAEWGDTLVLVHEAAVTPQGQVHVDAVPSDVPMFEQLIDAHGHVLRSRRSPAHVPGFNAVRPGAGTQCVGCHAGHSALPVAMSHSEGEWTNLAPAAEVTASTMHRDLEDARGAVDRLTTGEPAKTAWIADSLQGQWLRLQWASPLDVRQVVLYPWRGRGEDGKPAAIRVQGCEVVLFLNGREVRRLKADRELAPGGTALDTAPVRIDALEVRPLRCSGTYKRRALAALSEVAAIARPAWE